jgi:hypothetical protein
VKGSPATDALGEGRYFNPEFKDFNLIRSFNVYKVKTVLPSFFLLFSMYSQKNIPPFLRDTMAIFLPRATDHWQDLQRRNARLLTYPKQVVYFIVSFIALISLCHFLSMFYHFIIRNRIHEWKRRTSVSLTRLPAAVADSFRALAFRWTIPVGSSHELNFVEVGLTFAYMAVLYTWAFVNSMMLHLFPLRNAN